MPITDFNAKIAQTRVRTLVLHKLPIAGIALAFLLVLGLVLSQAKGIIFG